MLKSMFQSAMSTDKLNKGADKLQLLVDMVQERAWITVDASLIYWL